jgi:large subunit ribosomal protein L18Ae
MKIFAPNERIAKSRFWYFLKKTKKFKKIRGEIISVKEIFEKKPFHIKNFGVWLRYDSQSGTTNIFKEYRDVFVGGAVEQMYLEMAGRHRANWNSIILLRVEELLDKDCIRSQIKQYHNPKIKFPNFHSTNKDFFFQNENIGFAKSPITTLNIQ